MHFLVKCSSQLGTQIQNLKNREILKHHIFDVGDLDFRVARIDPSRQVDMDGPKDKFRELI